MDLEVGQEAVTMARVGRGMLELRMRDRSPRVEIGDRSDEAS